MFPVSMGTPNKSALLQAASGAGENLRPRDQGVSIVVYGTLAVPPATQGDQKERYPTPSITPSAGSTAGEA